VTLKVAWLLNIEDFDVGCDTVQSPACLPAFRRDPPSRICYQFEEHETRNFCPKTGGKRLFREIGMGMGDLKEIRRAESMNWINVAQSSVADCCKRANESI
jgi:hypothetical protein